MTSKSLRSVLLVEDNAGDARLLREMFNEEGSREIAVTHVERLTEAEEYLAAHAVDIILLDLGLPDAQGLEAVRRARAAAPRIPLVVLSSLDDESLAVRALQEGAEDYLVKGRVEAPGLLRALSHAIERKILEEALFAEKERAQVSLKCIGDAVVCTDTLGRVTFLNLVGEQATGWSSREAAGRPMSEVLRILDGRSRETFRNPLAMAIDLDQTMQLPPTWILIRRDGFEIPIEGSAAPIHDREGQPAGAVIVFRDVSSARAIALQMAHSAEHDVLTGLPNRLLLVDRVGQAIALAPRHMNKVVVLFLDLDGFKHINDSLGHSVGDKLLQSVARRLQSCVRGSDTVSRQGGDEFVVLLSAVERWEDTAITARRMLRTVAEPHAIDGHDLHISASIGVSVYPDDSLDAESLIKNADTAMYQAKENGRQGYKFFKPAMFVQAVERQSIEEGLRRALERQELALHYQPKVNLRTGEITGAEALIRWTHPVRGPVPPAEFIHVAEDCGLILPIGSWVLREACKQARVWAEAGLSAGTMAVNISAMAFADESFLEGIFTILEETGLDPGALELELTESVLMKRAEASETVLRALRAKKVHLAVDDFGTGYSSLSYLGRFPIDALKIDQSFVRQITTAPDETGIVTAVISMGQSLKLRVVAEGVETQEEVAFLQARGCEEAQGFYFSRAVPPQPFARLLETGFSSWSDFAAPRRRRAGGPRASRPRPKSGELQQIQTTTDDRGGDLGGTPRTDPGSANN